MTREPANCDKRYRSRTLRMRRALSRVDSNVTILIRARGTFRREDSIALLSPTRRSRVGVTDVAGAPRRRVSPAARQRASRCAVTRNLTAGLEIQVSTGRRARACAGFKALKDRLSSRDSRFKPTAGVPRAIRAARARTALSLSR